MGNLNEFKHAVDKITTAVEKVHQDIAHKPIEVVELIAPNLPLTKKVGDVQKQIIGSVYDAIRGVNEAIAGIAGDVGRTGEKTAKPPVTAKPERKASAPSVGDSSH
jgi:hypothetical protein